MSRKVPNTEFPDVTEETASGLYTETGAPIVR